MNGVENANIVSLATQEASNGVGRASNFFLIHRKTERVSKSFRKH